MANNYMLLVEDKPKDEILILRGLKKAGFKGEIRVARDGVQALDVLYEGNYAAVPATLPRLILLDIKLPKLSGLEVLERIREHEATGCVPVIMLSSSDVPRDLRRSCELGANSYIRKSTSAQRLNDALAALLRYWIEFHEQALYPE